MIGASEVFFLLFLQGIQIVYGVTLDKLSPCPDTTKTPKFSLQISISGRFPVMLLLLDKLVILIDLGLFTMFSVSAILVDLDLSIDLNFRSIASRCIYCFI